MAQLSTLRDGPLLLNPVSTYLTGPLHTAVRVPNSVAFPTLKAKIVTIVGTNRTVKLTSVGSMELVATTANSFLFEATNSTHLKLRLSSAQVETLATQAGVRIELSITSADYDLDDETVAVQNVSFSPDGIEVDATPDPIEFNVNGTTLSLVFSLPGAAQTPTFDTFADMIDYQSTMPNDTFLDAIVIDDESDLSETGRTNKYFLTSTYYSRYAFI